MLALIWRRFNTTGALCGVGAGLGSALALIIISPIVWGGPPGEPDTGAFTWYDLNNPGIISIPLGFIGCIAGTLLSRRREEERTFDELYVRSETGLGAERPIEEPRRERELVTH